MRQEYQEYRRGVCRELMSILGRRLASGVRNQVEGRVDPRRLGWLEASFKETDADVDELGDGAKVFRSAVGSASVRVGDGSVVAFSTIEDGARLTVGRNSCVSNLVLPRGCSLTVGDDCAVYGLRCDASSVTIGSGSVVRCVAVGGKGVVTSDIPVRFGEGAMLSDCDIVQHTPRGEDTAELVFGDRMTMLGGSLDIVSQTATVVGDDLLVLGPHTSLRNIAHILRTQDRTVKTLTTFDCSGKRPKPNKQRMNGTGLSLRADSVRIGNGVTITGMHRLAIGDEDDCPGRKLIADDTRIELMDGSELGMVNMVHDVDQTLTGGSGDAPADNGDQDDSSLRAMCESGKLLELAALSLGQKARLGIRIALSDRDKRLPGIGKPSLAIGDGATVIALAEFLGTYQGPVSKRCRLAASMEIAEMARTLVRLG